MGLWNNIGSPDKIAIGKYWKDAKILLEDVNLTVLIGMGPVKYGVKHFVNEDNFEGHQILQVNVVVFKNVLFFEYI